MTNLTLRRRSAILAVAIALAVTACTSGGTTTEPPAVFPPSTAPPTAVPVEQTEPDPGEGFELVAVTIDKIGVTAAMPQGWEQTTHGTYAGPDAVLEFDAELSDDVPDLASMGFEPIGQRVAGELTWDLHALDTGDAFIGLALTEIGDVTYIVALEAPPHLADDYLESVVMPVLRAFEAGEIPEIVVTLAGPTPEGADLGVELENLVASSELPAVGVAVFDADQILETAVAGLRRSGDPTPVELSDKFSIGSNVKAMTATLVGTFVDEGVLSWDTTVADIYGDSLGELDASMAQVTIRQLLTHTAGLNDVEAGFSETILGGIEDNRPLVEQRTEIARLALTQPAQHPAGEHDYSNIGYTTVGAVLEHLTGVPFEDLLQTRVFDALGMDSCGFYAPGTPGQVDQPWGHIGQRNGEPVDPGHPDAELGHAIAPAGTVHCNMADWARFLQSQLRGLRGSDTEIISPEAFVALASPAAGTDYAFGWVVITQPDGSNVIWHNGSNGRFTSETWLLPDEGRGVLIVTNIGVELAQAPMEQLADAIFARYTDDEGAGS